MPTERSCYGIPFVKLWRKQGWNCGLLPFLLKLRPTYELSSCQPITPYEDFVQQFVLCINSLDFPLVNKGGSSFMNVCWPPKEKLKLFASIGQSQEWWLLFNKK
jgi:hypothetical protein